MKALRYILIGLIFVNSGFLKGQDFNKIQNDLKVFLVDSFPVNNPRIAGNFQFEKGTEITQIKSSILDSLTGFVFYKTRLTTGMYEYYNLDIIAGVNYKDCADIRLLESPTYSYIDTNFLTIFIGVEIDDELTRNQYLNDFSKLFAEIEGRVGMLDNNTQNMYSFELWHGDLSWRIFDIVFENNQLKSINVQNGVSRFKMKEGYKRIDK